MSRVRGLQSTKQNIKLRICLILAGRSSALRLSTKAHTTEQLRTCLIIAAVSRNSAILPCRYGLVTSIEGGQIQSRTIFGNHGPIRQEIFHLETCTATQKVKSHPCEHLLMINCNH